MSNNHLNKFLARCRPFNTDLSIWVKFRNKHKNDEIIIEENKVIYKQFGIIAKFESNIEALRIMRLAGYKIKTNKVVASEGMAKVTIVLS